MIDQLIKKDVTLFKKTGIISGKRPASYWLLFLKKYTLVKQSLQFNKALLIFIIPLLLIITTIIATSISSNSDDVDFMIPVTIISFFASFVTFIIISSKLKKNFIHSLTFHHLARFIIHIKGDVHRALLSLRLDNSIIEADKNYITPDSLGLRKRAGIVYKPYQMERYALKFQFKDGSKGYLSLHQITIRVSSTRRRSSGKTKTKIKFKHKFFYQLILSLPKSKYKVANESILASKQEVYSSTVSKDDAMYYLKLKYKEKPTLIRTEIEKGFESQTSRYTNMLEFAIKNELFTAI